MKKLTEHFVLEEMCFSQSAVRHGIDNNVNAGSEEFRNLKRLCETVLEPLRVQLGKAVRITSGYRCRTLNKKIGGAATSQHVIGCAADIHVDGLTPRQVCKEIKKLGLPFDQLILEFNSWCHVSIAPAGRAFRGQQLTATRSASGKTIYAPGIR